MINYHCLRMNGCPTTQLEKPEYSGVAFNKAQHKQKQRLRHRLVPRSARLAIASHFFMHELAFCSISVRRSLQLWRKLLKLQLQLKLQLRLQLKLKLELELQLELQDNRPLRPASLRSLAENPCE